MKRILFVAAFLISLPALAQQAAPPTKLFSSGADVQALIAKAKAEHKGGNTALLVVNAQGYPMQLEYRTATTPPSIHPTHAELIEVVEGSCTLITGGTLVGAKPGAPGAMTMVGSERQRRTRTNAIHLFVCRASCGAGWAAQGRPW